LAFLLIEREARELVEQFRRIAEKADLLGI